MKKEIALAISLITHSQDVKISSIEIENFTVFKKENLEFSESLNIVIGENGLGKTHLLKLLSVLVSSYII